MSTNATASQTNVETVKKIYEAFGRGDLPAVLSAVGADVDWDYNTSTELPWLTRRRGVDGVRAYFEALGAAIEVTKFAPKEILATPDGKVVVALVDVGAKLRATGASLDEEDEIHVFRFGPDGKIARFRHGIDSARHVAAVALAAGRAPA